jgi:hypothetical protein
MNAERMKKILKMIEEQREKRKCKTGHYFEGKDGCKNCGRLLSAVLEGRDVQ